MYIANLEVVYNRNDEESYFWELEEKMATYLTFDTLNIENEEGSYMRAEKK